MSANLILILENVVLFGIMSFEIVAHSGIQYVCRDYVAFGIRSHSGLGHIRNFVIRDYVVRDNVARDYVVSGYFRYIFSD